MRKKFLLILVLLFAGYLVAGVRIIDQEKHYAILESRLFRTSPRIISSKVAYAPFPFFALFYYPKLDESVQLKELSLPFKSKDGIEFFIDGTITFSLEEEKALQLHALLRDRNLLPLDERFIHKHLQDFFSSHLLLSSRTRMQWLQTSRDVERSLSDEMRAYGVRIQSLQLGSVFFKDWDAAAFAALPKKMLFIGLDGADWAILHPLMKSGKLPNLERLMKSGSAARLATISPSLSPIVWSSIATGKDPEKHGITDFFAIDERTGKKIPVTSNLRRARALWNILGDAGISVGIIGWWATWPAEKVNGYMVADRVAYQLFGILSRIDSKEGKTYPQELYSELTPLIMKPEDVRWEDIERFFGPGTTPASFSGVKTELLDEFKTLYASTETYKNIFFSLTGRNKNDFTAIYFEGTDTVSHLFMRYREPRISGVTDDEMTNFGETVDRFYQYIDGIIGEILTTVDDSWTVIVSSDHGFKTGPVRPTSYDARIDMGRAAEWHDKYGVFIISGSDIKKGAFIEDGRITDILPTILALYGLPIGADMDGRILRGVFEDSFLDHHPLRYINSYEKEILIESESNPIESDIDDDIKEKLRSLGYISADSDNSFNNRGLLLMSRGDFDGAIEQFHRALEQHPDFIAALVNLGIAHIQKKEIDEAIFRFSRALSLDPNNVDVENLIANAYMEKNDYPSAERHLKRALAIEPAHTDTLNSLGIIYERIGDLDKAMSEYTRTIEIDPNYAEGYNNIGNIVKLKGKEEEAISWYQKAIKADPFFVGSYNNIALIYQGRGETERAIDFYLQAHEKSPANAIVMNNIGSLYFSNGDIESAITWWKKATEADPAYESPYNNLGAAYGKKGMLPEEIDMYRKALTINPEYIDARLNLGMALIRKGEWEQGISELKKIVKSEPSVERTWLFLARGYLGAEQYDEALHSVEEGLKYLPDSVLLLNMAGDISMYRGDAAKAIDYFKRSLKILPDQENITMRLRSLVPE